MISLSLPAPPSLNSSYANLPGRGRIASRALKSWKKEAGLRILLQKPGKIVGWFQFEATIQRMPRQKCADIDNRIKHLVDICVAHGVVDDDKLMVSVKGTWVSPGAGDACRVTISPASNGTDTGDHP